MKTFYEVITDHLHELELHELTELEKYINEAKQGAIKDLKELYENSEYSARKYLMNRGYTHAESWQFIKKYIHQTKPSYLTVGHQVKRTT